MKNHTWVKGYRYVKVPIYLIDFWKIRLFIIGYKKKRIGFLTSKDETFEKYQELLMKKVNK